MKGWLLANLFLIVLVTITAGYFWVFFSVVEWLALDGQGELYALIAASALTIYLAYLTSKGLHAVIERGLRRT